MAGHTPKWSPSCRLSWYGGGPEEHGGLNPLLGRSCDVYCCVFGGARRQLTADVGRDNSASDWWYTVSPHRSWSELGKHKYRPGLTLTWGSLVFSRTGQKVRTVCLPARSTLILLTYSGQGDMYFKIKSVYYVIISCHTLFWLRVFHLVLYVLVSLAT